MLAVLRDGKRIEQSHLKKTLADIIREIPCPREKNGGRGRPPVHSKQKLDLACLMMTGNNTYCGIESNLRKMLAPSVLAPVSSGSRNGNCHPIAPVAGGAIVAGAHLHRVLFSLL